MTNRIEFFLSKQADSLMAAQEIQDSWQLDPVLLKNYEFSNKNRTVTHNAVHKGSWLPIVGKKHITVNESKPYD